MRHTFLLENSLRRVTTKDRDQDTDPGPTHSQLLSLLDSEPRFSVSIRGFTDQDLTPVTYAPDNIDYDSLEVVYQVEDIRNLKTLLEQGVDWTIQLQKVVFVKDSEESRGGNEGSKGMPGGKGERTTVQSGRSSGNKVSQRVK